MPNNKDNEVNAQQNTNRDGKQEGGGIADHKTVSGEAGHVAGTHSGKSKDQVPEPHAQVGGDNFADQKVKVLSGRYSSPAHLDRTRLRK